MADAWTVEESLASGSLARFIHERETRVPAAPHSGRVLSAPPVNPSVGGCGKNILFFTLPTTPSPSESPLSGRAVR